MRELQQFRDRDRGKSKIESLQVWRSRPPRILDYRLRAFPAGYFELPQKDKEIYDRAIRNAKAKNASKAIVEGELLSSYNNGIQM